MTRQTQPSEISINSLPELRVAVIVLIALLCFSLARLVLWIDFFEDFQVLSVWQTFQAFVIGVRFDLSVLAVSMFVPLVMLLVSPSATTRLARAWQMFWTSIAYIVLAVLFLLMIADHLYFEDTHRHAGAEIKAITEDWLSLLNLAWRQYFVVTIAFFVFVAASLIAWIRVFGPAVWKPRRAVHKLLSVLAVICLTVVAARGGVMYRPIAVSDAFFSNQVTQGYLVLNGPFSITRALLAPSLSVQAVMPIDQAEQRVSRIFQGGVNRYLPPLSFEAAVSNSKERTRPNVVILLLESWGATQVDAMRQEMHLPRLHATPNFDSLAQSGRLFTNFYASGQRSIVGFSSIVTGLPVLPGMPAMGDGMEQFPINFLGNVAQSKGYQTIFIQSSERLSLRLNTLSARAGFDTYLGAEDIPELHETAKPTGVWGTWDHNTLQEANRQFSQLKQPFLGLVFTSTTHGPWLTPDNRWDKFPKDTDKGLAMNSLHYADWALGEFMAAAKKSVYYNNTIFILLADHASQFIENREDARNLFHIPFLMIGPGVKPGVDSRVGSQADLLPTLIDVTGWSGLYKTTGQSLLKPDRGGATALAVSDRVVTLITSKGWVSHDFSQRLGSGGLQDLDLHSAEQDLFALYQVTTNAQLIPVAKPR